MPYMDNARHVAQNPSFVRHQGPPKLYATTDLRINLFRLAQQGYLAVAYSLDPSECDNLGQAKQTAQKIGVPITLVQTGDAKLQGVLDAYPSPPLTQAEAKQFEVFAQALDGQSFAKLGSKLNPSAPDGAECAAVFLAKLKAGKIGVLVDAVPAKTRAQINQNYGRLVFVVIKGSPADRADISAGDVLLEVNGQKIASNRDLAEALGSCKKRTFTFTIWRGGKTRTVLVENVKLSAPHE
jgi:membrane-associated protease RseP (regulator of RpoE activity)